jgi:hypothetical protein
VNGDERNFEAEAAEMAAPLVVESADMYDDGLDFEPSDPMPVYTTPCVWKAPFTRPVAQCQMCGQRPQIQALGDVAGLTLCCPCARALNDGESDEERRAEEAAEAYHSGYGLVMW